jgi:hypothetical protein
VSDYIEDFLFVWVISDGRLSHFYAFPG